MEYTWVFILVGQGGACGLKWGSGLKIRVWSGWYGSGVEMGIMVRG